MLWRGRGTLVFIRLRSSDGLPLTTIDHVVEGKGDISFHKCGGIFKGRTVPPVPAMCIFTENMKNETCIAIENVSVKVFINVLS